MLISFTHQFLFIHIYKVAGSSIKKALQPYAWDPEKQFLSRLLKRVGIKPLLPFDRYRRLPDHTTALEARAAYSQSTYEQMFKFAFVRNPWDWQVSLYHFMCQRTDHRQHAMIHALPDFESYLHWRIEEDMHLQKDFVTDDENKLIVDFVGRYEHLERDFQYICDRLGIHAVLPHLNPSTHGDYRQYYSVQSAEMVATAFAEDIEYFGYQFNP